MGYFIYRIYNIEDNTSYIGQTTQSLKERFRDHIRKALYRKKNNKLSKAIRTLGSKLFNIEPLFYLDEISLSELTANQIQDLLDSKEKYFIEKFDSINQGYNSKSGGQGYTERNNLPPEEIIRKKQLQRIKYRETQKKYYLEHREEILNKRKAVSHIKRQRQILRDLEHPEKKDQRKKLHSDYMKSHRSEHKSRIQKRKQEAIKCQA